MTEKEQDEIYLSLDRKERDQLIDVICAVRWWECARDPHVFAEHIITKDEHGEGRESEKPFPLRDEDPAVWDFIDTCRTDNLLLVEKSRQLMITWAACLYVLWVAKFGMNRLCFVQSKKEEDAANLVYNTEMNNARISFMESKLPSPLQSVTSTSYSKLVFAGGSIIWGIPEGGDKVRSYTASLIFSDEFAFQPEAEEAWKAARPTVSGGGQFLAVSTARAGAYMKQLLRRA